MLVNGLFCFCSKHHVGSALIRLLHENEITYCNKWRPKGLAVEVLYNISTVGWVFFGGAYARDKNTSVRLCANNAGEGGRICETLRYIHTQLTFFFRRGCGIRRTTRCMFVSTLHHLNKVTWKESFFAVYPPSPPTLLFFLYYLHYL